ncbi:MAG TPA: hypothetical protein VKN62_02455, partial [Pelovirga sp.]|nr:hypothetical protein [Pelovirga sp.]
MKRQRITSLLEGFIFTNRPLLLGMFIMITLLMGYSLSNLRIDAGFAKQLPLQHEYMQTYIDHGQEFGGANRI